MILIRTVNPECINCCNFSDGHKPGQLKILQSRLQQYVNWELSDVQAGLEEAQRPEIKLPTSTRSQKMQESSRKTSTYASLTTPKPLTVWITTNCRKFFEREEYQTILPAPWEICTQVKQQQLEPNINNGLDPNWERSKQGYILSSCLFNLYADCVSCEMSDWMMHKLESRMQGEMINSFRYAEDTTLMAVSEDELKTLLMKGKDKSEKAGLKLNMQKT